tara:strand:- start:2886 stop:4139 length:1254 start_codon:yes stop_codon:yes gene_type:complete
MIIIYRLIINIIFIISPFIIIFRLIKKKEDPKRFKEKFCFFSKKRGNGKLIWFHGASVGELQSIVPLLEILQKDKKISKILVTSNTLSSSKIIDKIKLNKVIHQFFPIDTNFYNFKFLNYWNPSASFFIDSEIWPNMYLSLKKKGIPIILLNGRITKKSFLRWKFFSTFSKKIFGNFNLCLSSDEKSKKYLKILGGNNIKFFGNLKFSQSEKEKIDIENKLEGFFSKKNIWCASSTHDGEEKFLGLVHKELKKKYKNLLTILIPRHVERVKKISSDLKLLNLKIHLHQTKGKIPNDTDIYIVNAYGKNKSFYNICKNVFLGGSLINHGGQNPLEAVRYGCNILHGPQTYNFTEIYSFLKRKNISKKINSQKQMVSHLEKLFSKRPSQKKIQKKLNFIGQNILNKTYNEVKLILKNEI